MNEQQLLISELSELKNIVEAALLAAGGPLTVRSLKSLFPADERPTTEQIREVLGVLEKEYQNRGVELRQLGKGYRFQSREKYAPWIRKLNEGRSPRYSRALLETLAIIAYQQPVTRGDIEEIRGVGVTTDIIRTLLQREWIKEVGHRDVPGHPALFGTTSKFLEYFNLGSLSDLPPLKDRRDPREVAKELNLRLPLEITEEGVKEKIDLEESKTDPDISRSAEIIHLDSAGNAHAETNIESENNLDVDGGREAT